MKTPIEVLIVDNEPYVWEALTAYITTAADMVVVGTCIDGVEAVDAVRANPPDVVLMDLQMPRMNGFDATKAIIAIAPATKVIALTTYYSHDEVPRFLRDGGSGFLIKSARSEDVLIGIRSVHGGVAVLSPAPAKILSEKASLAMRPTLTSREEVTLEALTGGLTNTAISRRLYSSLSIVKTDVASLKHKFGATTRADLIAKAKRLGPLE